MRLVTLICDRCRRTVVNPDFLAIWIPENPVFKGMGRPSMVDDHSHVVFDLCAGCLKQLGDFFRARPVKDS